MNNWALDNYNYYADERTKGKAEAPILYLENGDEKPLPMKYEVCPVCEGRGKHVNPSIDAGGLSEEMMDDPDFLDGYMRGDYDVRCNRCGGKRVVPAVDWSKLTKEEADAYEAQLREEAADEAERLAEIRMGC